jgi:DNA-binding transcriptional regulator LsrR (DeoR family)
MAKRSSKSTPARIGGKGGPAAGDAHRAAPQGRPKVSNSHSCGNESLKQRLLLEYRRYLQKDTTLPKIAHALAIDQREVRVLLREAFKVGAIIVHTPENRVLRDRMSQAWRNPRYHVLNAKDGPAFYSGAADVFFFQLDDLLRKRQSDADRTLRLGIVSGETTGGMIEALCELDSWQNRFKSDSLPQTIRVYALNVSQTSGYRGLSGNANILAFQLTRKLKREFPDLDIDVLGLSTDLLQLQKDAQRSDIQPQTELVLKHTDPARLRASLHAEDKNVPEGLGESTELDIVITGVGSIKSSLFKQYCEASGFDLNTLARDEKIVGDIAYCPVNLLGEPRQLRRDGRDYVFYSAVSLDVLTGMAKLQDRKVILVARNAGDKNKVDPIHAAIGGYSQHCNVLITDQDTADELLKRHQPPVEETD